MGGAASGALDLSLLVATFKGDLSDKYDIVDQLGSGAQGVAYKVKCKLDGAEYVAKKTFGDKMALMEEFGHMKEMRHPNCAKVIEMIVAKELVDGEWREQLFVISELARGSDLHKYMLRMSEEQRGRPADTAAPGPEVTEEWCAGVYRQAMEGVAYMHSKAIVHNDLKPDNILIMDKFEPANPNRVPTVTINDFGCATRLKVANSTTTIGDPRYQSPESWRLCFKYMENEPVHEKLDGKTDVWSMGATLYELLSGGIIPFIYRPCTISDIDAEVFSCLGKAVTQEPVQFREHFDSLSVQGESLLRGMLTKDGAERPSAAEVLKHDWFSIRGKPISSESLQRLQVKAVKGRAHAMLLNAVSLKLQRDHFQACMGVFKDIQLEQNGQITLDEFRAAMEKLRLRLETAKGSTPGATPTGQPQHEPVADDAAQADDAELPSRDGGSWTDLSDPEVLFRQADVDQSETLDFNEFVAVTFDWSSLDVKTMTETLQKLINDLDKNDDGQLSRDELGAAFHGALGREELNQVFDHIDENGDGVVNPEELRRFLFEPASKEELNRLACVQPPRRSGAPRSPCEPTPECFGAAIPLAACLGVCLAGVLHIC